MTVPPDGPRYNDRVSPRVGSGGGAGKRTIFGVVSTCFMCITLLAVISKPLDKTSATKLRIKIVFYMIQKCLMHDHFTLINNVCTKCMTGLKK